MEANAGQERLVIPDLTRQARRRRLLLLGVLLAAVAGGIAYFARPTPAVERFRTTGVERRDVVRLVEATGHVDVRQRVEVPAPMPGRLQAILVRAGDQVDAGQPLARLDNSSAVLNVRSAQATQQAAAGRVAEARAALQASKQTLERTERLAARGLTSEEQLASARAAVERAQATLDAASAEGRVATENVAAARHGQQLAEIVAPSAGVALRAPERLGAAVGPERGPLFVLGEPLDVMRIDAPVSETDIAAVAVGQIATFDVQALAGRTFEARVEHVGIDPQREGGVVRYPVTLLAENPDGALLPGMTAVLRLEVDRAEQILAVHEAALRFTPQGAPPAAPRSRVWRRVGPSALEVIPVRAGLSDGVHTQVTPLEEGALHEGDPLVIGLLQTGNEQSAPNISLGRR